ncbi:hypothetical protein [Oceanobacillus saliphilus]|uniref:hypothetical protein n=1 Tax=Oceanobacillus saliphilus TaxID=2925834 RepID=UPI00201DC8CB|nr:hypothetical protein [Oceanobacillus saliphilus]
MKKVIGILLAGVLFFSACNAGDTEEVESNSGQTDETTDQAEESNGQSGGNQEEVEDLKLQVTKVDEDAGVTIENNETYQTLNEFVKQNRKYGVPNDFSMLSVSMMVDEEGNQQMLFLGVNRLGAPVKNVTFNITLGSTEGDMVWEDFLVTLDEETAGVLENNAALPIFLPVTSQEQIDAMNTISQENLVMEINNFNFETVDQ